MRNFIAAKFARLGTLQRQGPQLAAVNLFTINSTKSSGKLFKKKAQNQSNMSKATSDEQNVIKRFDFYQDVALSLLNDYNRYFHEDRAQLPEYLRKLSKIFNEQIYLKHRKTFDIIYEKINRCSSELILEPQQLLQIMIFIEKYLRLSSKLEQKEIVIVNNGFQHRATMLAATFLFNRQFSFTQSITIFKILTNIGSVSMLFLVNLAKIIKLELQAESAKEKIKLEHILTILGTYFIKDNRTIVNNVVYDMTLNYLLKNDYLLNSASFPFKIETISYMLKFDFNYFYLSQRSQLNRLLSYQIDQLIPLIQSQSFNLLKGQKQINSFSLSQAAQLIQDCEEFLRKNIVSQIQQNISKLLKTIFSFLQSSAKSIDHRQSTQKIDVNLLMRALFQKQMFIHARSNEDMCELFQILRKSIPNIRFINQSTVTHLIQLYYECEAAKDNVSFFIHSLYEKMLEKEVFITSVAKFMIDSSNRQQVISIVNQLCLILNSTYSKLSLKENLCLMNIIFTANFKNPEVLKVQKIHNTYQKLKQRVKECIKTQTKFIEILSEVTSILHSTLNSEWISSLLSPFELKNMLQFTIPNQFDRKRHQRQYLHILSFYYLKNPNLKVIDFEKIQDFIIYSYIVQLYPRKNFTSQELMKSHDLLQTDQTFLRGIDFLITLAGKFEKFFYLVWDVFMNNYVFRSENIRRQSFGLLKKIFFNAYEKQKARRVVILSMLTNYIGSGVIIASKNELKELFQRALLPLIQTKVEQKFHYHCFLQIVFNAKSCGILSDQIFTKIIKRCLASSHSSDQSSFRTSLLFLFYGMTLKGTSDNAYIQEYQQQRRYLQILLNKQQIVIIKNAEYRQIKTMNFQNKNLVFAGSKYICVLLSYGEKEIMHVTDEILDFIENCKNLCQFMMILHSFKVQSFNLQIKELKNIIIRLNQLFLSKLTYFYDKGILIKEDYQNESKIILQNLSKINDSQK